MPVFCIVLLLRKWDYLEWVVSLLPYLNKWWDSEIQHIDLFCMFFFSF